MVGLSKQPEGTTIDASKAVAALVPAYVELLTTLKGLGVPEVQIHEPILTTHRADALKANFTSSFTELSKVGLAIDLVTYYDDVGASYPWVVTLPVQVCCSPLAGFYIACHHVKAMHCQFDLDFLHQAVPHLGRDLFVQQIAGRC